MGNSVPAQPQLAPAPFQAPAVVSVLLEEVMAVDLLRVVVLPVALGLLLATNAEAPITSPEIARLRP